MSEKLSVTPVECQEKGELEAWAEDYVDSRFLPLYLSDLFYLDQLSENDNAWMETAQYLQDRWSVPDEDQVQACTAIERYAPK